MFLYIDFLFADRRERVVRPLAAIPKTLNRLYLMVMREHAREAVLLHRAGSRWSRTPDWRFDRQVIRLGLYLGEHVGVEPGDRVAVVSEARPEWLLADFAIAGLGATSVAVDPGLDSNALVAALADAAPRAAFVSREVLEKLEGVRGRVPTLREILAFDGPVDENPATSFASALDLGGTLDTPERAQWFRRRSGEVSPDEPVVRHYGRYADGSVAYQELTQAETIEQVRSHWLEQPARQGDLAYLVGPEVTLSLRLVLYAFVGDGYTTVALGTPQSEPGEMMDLRPDKIVAPSPVLEAAVRRQLARANGNGRGGGLGDRIRRAAHRVPLGRSRRHDDGILEGLGGRARWIRPTAPLDPALLAQLSTVGAVEPIGATPHHVAHGAGRT